MVNEFEWLIVDDFDGSPIVLGADFGLSFGAISALALNYVLGQSSVLRDASHPPVFSGHFYTLIMDTSSGLAGDEIVGSFEGKLKNSLLIEAERAFKLRFLIVSH